MGKRENKISIYQWVSLGYRKKYRSTKAPTKLKIKVRPTRLICLSLVVSLYVIGLVLYKPFESISLDALNKRNHDLQLALAIITSARHTYTA